MSSVASTAIVIIGLVSGSLSASTKTAKESARDIPVAYDVDVVVVGGSSAAVSAAVEAAERGADVFLAAPRPYLGEDLCATYRLWLEPGKEPTTPLAKALFAEPPAPITVGPGVPFTYTTDIPSSGVHKDTSPPSKLADGKWGNAYKHSIEYGGDVSITIDLKKKARLGKLHVMAFQRRGDIEVESVTISASDYKTSWTRVGQAKNEVLGVIDFIDSSFCMTVPLKVETRYLKVLAKKSGNVERLLLGEIIVELEKPAQPAKPSKAARVPPMPMQVKRSLDRALLDAGVQFLYGCYATDVLRDANGYPAGVVMANRSGRQAVRAKVIIDATPRAQVARIAGATFTSFTGGDRTFKRIVIGGEVRQDDRIRARKMPTRVQTDRSVHGALSRVNAFEYTFDIPMKDASFASFAEADQLARDLTWHRGQVGASEIPFRLPSDPMKGQASVSGDWPGAEAVDLNAFRPEGEQRLYVLSGAADVSRKAAERLVDPLEFMAVGKRIGRAAAEEADVVPKPRIACFGDSITAADYPLKLGKKLRGFKIVNAGVGGNTTGQGLARLDKDVLGHKPKAVVVLFGTNDSVLIGPKRYRMPLDRYEENLREIVQRCRDAGAKVLLCTLPPIIAEPYHQRHPKAYYDADGGLAAILLRYRQAAIRVGESTGVSVLDLHKVLPKDRTTLKAGGVHPTDKGEEIIADLVAGELAKMIGPMPERRSPLDGVRVAGKQGKPDVSGEVREKLVGVRPTQKNLPTIRAGDRLLPVLGEYDVVVVGGGTGGAPAGIGAGRHKAKTLVIEYLHGLGGVGTLGLIGKYYWGYREGFTAEVDAGVGKLGGSDKPATPGWNVEWKMEWYRRELRKAGADIWFGTLGCGAFVEDGRVKGVIVATPEQRGVVLAKVVIDSTGNSDIAATAGARCVFTDGSHVAVQGTGMPPRKPGASYTNTDYTLTDDADVVDMWRTFVAGREKYKNAYDLGQIIDTRERRRIVGDVTISPLDIYNQRTYPDSIGLSRSNFDTHGFTIHPLFALKVPDKKGATAYTPYRALLPKGLDGILVTGLGISAHRDAMPILRMQADIQNQGYAAGTAAAMAARSGKRLRDIDLKALQKHLVEIGSVPESVLTDKDSFPMSKDKIARAVLSVVEDYKGIGLILAQPSDALPFLQKACKAARTEETKLIYAHILGMLGDPTGVESLVKSITGIAWDAGWSFKGGGQFGASLSPIDSRIIALGKTRDKRAIAPIIEKVGQLGPENEFSHHRAVAVALETLGNRDAAAPLAELLKKPGMTGYAATTIDKAKRAVMPSNPNLSRDQSLRELILARALFRCGDHQGLGESILKEYQKDIRGHHARHANAVLQGVSR